MDPFLSVPGSAGGGVGVGGAGGAGGGMVWGAQQGGGHAKKEDEVTLVKLLQDFVSIPSISGSPALHEVLPREARNVCMINVGV